MKNYSKYRYSLDTSSKKYLCPACGKKEFVRYIDTDTGELMDEKYGRCERINSCGYFYHPGKDYKDQSNYTQSLDQRRNKALEAQTEAYRKTKEAQGALKEIFISQMEDYENNNFIQFLLKYYSRDAVFDAIERYNIGTFTHKYKNLYGAAIFWQIDQFGQIRGGKVMQYNPDTGKRLKEPGAISWIHKLAKTLKEDFQLNQCFFGLHIKDLGTKIRVVESEKTAVIGSLEYPQYTWLAAGGKSNFNANKMRDLAHIIKGTIEICPDSDGFVEWGAVAKQSNLELRCKVILNYELAGQPENISDFADLILSKKTNSEGENSHDEGQILPEQPGFLDESKFKKIASVNKIREISVPPCELLSAINEAESSTTDLSIFEQGTEQKISHYNVGGKSALQKFIEAVDLEPILAPENAKDVQPYQQGDKNAISAKIERFYDVLNARKPEGFCRFAKNITTNDVRVFVEAAIKRIECSPERLKAQFCEDLERDLKKISQPYFAQSKKCWVTPNLLQKIEPDWVRADLLEPTDFGYVPF